ncbi:MAG: ATP synthase F1 subunit delta [Hominimerdicola sp.]
MAESVEKVYGTALFQLCTETDELDGLFEELDEVADIISCNENKDFCELLSSPSFSKNEKVAALKTVFEGKVSELILDFLCVLAENGRMKFLSQIRDEFRCMYYSEKGIIEVQAITAVPLNNALREKLINKLQTVSGKKIILTETVDKSILGGIVLKYGNNQLDSSVKTKLNRLKASIENVIA